MSTFCEVPFELLDMNGSNYISWSAHIRNVLRTMGPFEQAIKTSILPKDLNNLSSKEKECLLCNRRVIDLLFESMDKDFADSLYKRRRNFQRYVLMHIAFGNSSRQYAKILSQWKSGQEPLN